MTLITFLTRKDAHHSSFLNSEPGSIYYYTFFEALYISITGKPYIIPFSHETPSQSNPEDLYYTVLFFDWPAYNGHGNQPPDPVRV